MRCRAPRAVDRAAGCGADVRARAPRGAMRAAGARPVFADCNAVAPATVRGHRARDRAVGRAVRRRRHRRPRAWSWRRAHALLCLGRAARAPCSISTSAELELVDLGDEIGTASAMKMAYSSLNKGTDALLTAVLLAAERLGVREPLMRELEFSQAEALEAHARARAVPGRDGEAVRARDGRDRARPTRASASRRSFIAAPSGSTRSSRRRRSRTRRARRSRSSARSTRRSPC